MVVMFLLIDCFFICDYVGNFGFWENDMSFWSYYKDGYYFFYLVSFVDGSLLIVCVG